MERGIFKKLAQTFRNFDTIALITRDKSRIVTREYCEIRISR